MLRGWPSKSRRPAVGWCRRSSRDTRVLFPAPGGPISASTSPGRSSRDTPWGDVAICTSVTPCPHVLPAVSRLPHPLPVSPCRPPCHICGGNAKSLPWPCVPCPHAFPAHPCVPLPRPHRVPVSPCHVSSPPCPHAMSLCVPLPCHHACHALPSCPCVPLLCPHACHALPSHLCVPLLCPHVHLEDRLLAPRVGEPDVLKLEVAPQVTGC